MNRTCNLIIDYDITDEFKKALKGIPLISHKEYTFCGHTLCAKWIVAHAKKLKKCQSFYVKNWGDGEPGEATWDLGISWMGTADSFDEKIAEAKALAEDPNELDKDSIYIAKGLSYHENA